ncbi:MAG: ribonuclease III [Vannielia sp.]|uniref:ribonuclease III n=1 Tax=Rhodobacterales TaxID=204455 RepID=UPI0020941148|nr:ribonuclease III [Oceanicola sp. 502str15]MCO6384982.1 ribonuclease III [Oceanicola sp. 502str15]
MKPSAEVQAFAVRLGHQFAQPALLLRALTHPSFSTAGQANNQRLEFLGDRVLGLVVAEALMEADPAAAEGQLSPRFHVLVNKETCAEVAREIGVGEVLKLGRSEMQSGGRRKEALLGDAMEAVIAAVYRDAGFDAARAVVLRHWGKRVAAVEADAKDAKTALQEWAQARGLPPPAYELRKQEGDGHEFIFHIAAVLTNGEEAMGKARRKKLAEHEAARALLDRLQG